jgi:acetyltransferase-like isoleucine patch superfamily enzyme
MPVRIDQNIIDKLRELGVSSNYKPGVVLPDDVILETPCSLKSMQVVHSLRMGAFSYAVNGYYFACRIGRYCSIGEQVQIGRHSHPLDWHSTSPIFYFPYTDAMDQPPPYGHEVSPKSFVRSTPPTKLKITEIGNDVWIGHGAFLLPGVKIGDGAVIAAMSVVTKDVAPYTIVGGNPAGAIRKRFSDELIAKLLESKWWQYAPWDLAGARIDKPEEFVEFVLDIRKQGVANYVAPQVQLSNIAE